MPRTKFTARYTTPRGVWACCDDFEEGTPDYEGRPMLKSNGLCTDFCGVLEAVEIAIAPGGSGALRVRFFRDVHPTARVYHRDEEAIAAWMTPLDWADSEPQTDEVFQRGLRFANESRGAVRLDGKDMPFEEAARKLWGQKRRGDGGHTVAARAKAGKTK